MVSVSMNRSTCSRIGSHASDSQQQDSSLHGSASNMHLFRQPAPSSADATSASVVLSEFTANRKSPCRPLFERIIPERERRLRTCYRKGGSALIILARRVDDSHLLRPWEASFTSARTATLVEWLTVVTSPPRITDQLIMLYRPETTRV